MSNSGWLEVITGPMFSGKTEELIRRLRRARIARQKLQAFKPFLDARYDPERVISHAGSDFEATPVRSARDIPPLVEGDTNLVAIDEGQFFDEDLLLVVRRLLEQGIRVIVAGLDTDFRGEPFGPIPALMAEAEQLEKLQAICMVCGGPASRTQRLINGRPAHTYDPVIAIGASEMYEARCRTHHAVPKE